MLLLICFSILTGQSPQKLWAYNAAIFMMFFEVCYTMILINIMKTCDILFEILQIIFRKCEVMWPQVMWPQLRYSVLNK